MGYRSDGLWIIKGHKDDVIAALAAARMNVPPPEGEYCSLDNFEVYTSGDTGYIKFQYEGLRWYDGYADVEWFNRLWAFWSDDEKLNGTRVRVGENDDDIDRDTFGDDWPEIYVQRVIEAHEPMSGEPLIPEQSTN